MIRKRFFRNFLLMLIIMNFLGTGKVDAALKSKCDQCGGSLSHSSYKAVTASSHTAVASCDNCGINFNNPGTESCQFSKIAWWKHSETYHRRSCPHCSNYEQGQHTGGTATCTSRPKCSTCKERYGSANGHKFGDWTTTNPTCTTDGSKSRTCSVCGTVESETISKLGHDKVPCSCGESEVCTRGCWLNDHTCHKCSFNIRDWDNSNHWYKCSCGAVDSSTKGTHTMSESSRVNATCTADGAINYKCSAVLCGYTSSQIITAIGHSWPTNWTVTAATCTSEGSKIKICQNGCGGIQSEPIPATGHSWPTNWTVTAATCTSEGSKIKICQNGCGGIQSEPIPATGHSWPTNWTVTAATCTSEGSKIKRCKNGCGEIQSETIPATGHSWPTNWTVTAEATCTSAGSKIKRCQNGCGEIQSGTIPAIGHTWGNWVLVTAPGCTTKGKEKRTCSNNVCTETRDVSATGHTESGWLSDKNYHWTECVICSDIIYDYTVHSDSRNNSTGASKRDGLCDVCGWRIITYVTPPTADKIYTYNGKEQTITLYGFDSNIMNITNHKKTNVGTYKAEVTLKNTSVHNWDIVGKETSTIYLEFEIIPKDITIKWNVGSYYYNGKEQAPTATATGVNGEQLSITVKGGIDAKTHTAVATTNSNYNITNPTQNFTISPKELTVIWGETELMYNGTEQAPTAMADTGVAGESVTLTRTKKIEVGNYTSTATISSVTGGRATISNYSLKNPTQTYQIVEKPIVRPIVIGTYTYNGKTQQVELKDFNSSLMNISNNTRIDAGSQEVIVSLKDSKNYTWDNNSKTNLSLTFTINPKTVAVDWGNKFSFVYNAQKQGPDPSANSGVEGETINLNANDTKQINVGNYMAIVEFVSVTGGRAKKTNYELTNLTKEFEITRANINPIVKMNGYEYAGKNGIPKPSVEGNIENGSETYYYNTVNSNSGGQNWTTVTNTSYLTPGAYWMYVIVGQTHNYNSATSPATKFIVGQAPDLTIDSGTAYAKSKTATVTIFDPDKNLANMDNDKYLQTGEIEVFYEWTKTTETPGTYSESIKIPVGANTSEVTGNITKTTDSGIWYLHVKATMKDMIGYTRTREKYGMFYLDNTAPVITIKPNENETFIEKNTCKITLMVTDIHSGIDTNEFTAEDIIVYVSKQVSVAEKQLKFIKEENGVYTYELTISGATETGWMSIEIPAGVIKDRAGNPNEQTIIGEDELNIFADNTPPVVSGNGPISIRSVTTGKRYIEPNPHYINKEYEIEIPMMITDVGTGLSSDDLEPVDIQVRIGDFIVATTQKDIEVVNEEVIEDPITKIRTYQKTYILVIKGIAGNGYLRIGVPLGSVKDKLGNENEGILHIPKTSEDTEVYVDNTIPRIIVEDVIRNKNITEGDTVKATLKVKEPGAGIFSEQFTISDIEVQIDGKTETNVEKELIPYVTNRYDTELGGDEPTNYTYELVLSGIKKDGLLRLKIEGLSVIDKSNNGNEIVTLDLQLQVDNEGPRIGPITTNANAQGEVHSEPVMLRVSDCVDDSGIAKYEWQVSKDGVTWETIKTENSSLSTSTAEKEYSEDNDNYYRVLVSDTLGNTSISQTVQVSYRTAKIKYITIRLKEEQISDSLIKIHVVIKSDSMIKKVMVNNSEIAESVYKENVIKNNSEYTTTFSYDVSLNGMYEFEVHTEKGEIEREKINISLIDTTKSEIQYVKYNATALSKARIVFTSNEPIRIINANQYDGMTFSTTSFDTRTEVVLEPTVTFDVNRTFEFENKGLLKIEVEVEAPIITKVMYIRFSKSVVSNYGLTQKEIQEYVNNIPTAKEVTGSMQIFSYYGFKNERTNVKVATNKALNLATTLGNANETYVINEMGEKEKLESNEEINVTINADFVNNNLSGMQKNTSGLLTDFNGIVINATKKYGTFRIMIIP